MILVRYNFISSSIYITISSILLLSLMGSGNSSEMAAIIVAIYGFSNKISKIILGPFLDRIQSRYILIIVSIVSLFVSPFLLMGSGVYLYGAAILLGSSISINNLTYRSLVAEYHIKRPSAGIYNSISKSSSLSALLIPVISLYVFQVKTVYSVIFLCVLISLQLFFCVFIEGNIERIYNKKLSEYVDIFLQLNRLFFVNSIWWLSFSPLNTVLVYLMNKNGFSEFFIGMVIALNGLVILFFQKFFLILISKRLSFFLFFYIYIVSILIF